MAIHVSIHHKTSYRYDRLVGLGPQIVRLRPAPHCRTPIVSYSLKILPEGHFINWQQDPYANYQARLVFPEKVKEFMVEVDLVAELAVQNPFDFFLEPSAMEYPVVYQPEIAAELRPFFRRLRATPLFKQFLKKMPTQKQRTIDFLVQVNQLVQKEIGYIVRLEPGVYTPEETLTKKMGSCRDSAWLLVQVLRHLGVAARFVSGYLVQLTADVKALDGPSGTTTDFTDLHAWTEVFLPGAGWIGFDATSGLLAGEGHIPLACSPDPTGASPISGGVDAAEVEFGFEMSVTRLLESPRVTKPYSEDQWSQIDQLGEKVDRTLKAGDVRLTMGGEPTFVSIDDMEGAEWNTAAVGPTKRKLAEQLTKRLWEKYGKGGFLHYGQGKWYPGESLPRWAFLAMWRRDGVPIWKDPALLADIGVPSDKNGHDAEDFARALAAHLGVGDRWLMPAYEDTYYYLWKERRLPYNVDVKDSRLADKEERSRIAKVFEEGLNKVTGFCLPLERGWAEGKMGWLSGPWFLRADTLFLIPGDSPMGLRLPLESQPWVAPTDARLPTAPDPMIDLPPFVDPHAPARLPLRRPGSFSQVLPEPVAAPAPLAAHLHPRPQGLPPPSQKPSPFESASWVVRTALCVEAREGHVFVFMPPTQSSEEYLDLLTHVESAAAAVGCPVVLEGYLPPYDPRLDSVKVTPDPGVIEVNIHPASTWRQLSDHTEFIYQAARECRLGTDKFMIDGRHTGTGGGNHIVFGGAKPSDSPLLRRPHLLRSLISYWHQHPALSYLFSGLFIGPTSQAPRIDEARNDSLYELEIAFRELKTRQAEGPPPPWLVDRIFRNLLTDVTGNTHRAEFCIDKLYSPDSATGRLGLLEMRAFEMPPHERMSLVQQLLMRACIARFWEVPFEPARLARWGTDLHDRFMLPHFVQQDLNDVVADFAAAGYAFETSWFAPHMEFRFPRHGVVRYLGIELELRHALEPWHVMGEEGGGGGTVRFVDSSVERVQVKVSGLVPERYFIACNGIQVPLQNTGVVGEYVAGVRYRAWQPTSALHPTIGVNAPLVFDLVDSWNRRVVGGCTYHVAHPGGRSYDTFPVNSYEAESRRLARFQPFGHTPGETAAAHVRKILPEFPATLDLRNPVSVERP